MLRITVLGVVFLLATVATFDESYDGNKVLALTDNVKPTVLITSPINNTVVSAGNVIVTGTAFDIDSGINSVQVKINSGSPITATPKSLGDWSIWTISILFSQSGSNTITVKAIDNAGNIQLVTSSLTVDTTTPTAPIITNSSLTTNNKTPKIVGTAETGSTVKLFDSKTQIGSATATGGSWSIVTSTLTDGSHTIRANATDTAGNKSPNSASITLTVDTTTPTVTITAPTNNAQVFTNMPIIQGTTSDSGSGVKKVEVSIDYGAYTLATGTTSWSYTPYGQISTSSHTVTARATDNSGKTATTSPITFTVVVDTTKPTISITSPSNGATINAGNFTVTGTASDIGSGVKSVLLFVNGSQTTVTPNIGSWSTWTASIPITKSGSNILGAQVIDNAGYQTTTSIQLTVLDKTPPTVSITSPSNSATISTGNFTVTGTASDIGSGVKSVKIKIGSGAYVTATPNLTNDWSKWFFTLPVIKIGSTTLSAQVIDNAGYQTTTSIQLTVLDKTPPTVSITSPSNGATINAGNFTVTGTASDIGSGVTSVVMFVNGTNQTAAMPKITGNWSSWTAHLLISQPGSNTLVVQVTDNSNNSMVYSFPINVADKTARLAKSPSPTMFWFIVRNGFPDMTNLIQLYQKHAKPSHMITQFTNSLLDSSVTTSISNMKSVTYFSLSDMQNNANILHTNGYKWIVYDLEPDYSPANEISDPVNSVLQASQIAHSNGLGLAITQAQIPQSYFQGMATYSDAFVLQVQDRINGDPTIFLSGIKYNINLIRTANPNEIVFLQGSTMKDTPNQINAAYDMTYKMIDGLTVFYNMTSTDVPKMAQVFTHVDGIS